MRPYRPESFNKFSVGLGNLGFEFIITPRDYTTTAASIRNCYTAGLKNLHKNGRAGFFPFVEGMIAAVQSVPADGSLFLDSTTTFTSLGVIENKMRRAYNGFEVRDFYFGEDKLSPMMQVIPITWRGELRLMTTYNVALRTEEKIAEFGPYSARGIGTR
jgi:hypothetical protein